MLHRALQQFLADVYWGDLDVLLMDLPPGTGDIAISVAQLLPSAEILVVTTPQQAAAEVAERAGAIAAQTHQQVVGVIENMSYLPCPHCGERSRRLRRGRRPDGRGRADPDARHPRAAARPGADRRAPARGRRRGHPLVLADPDAPRRQGAPHHRRQTSGRPRARGLAGMSLGISAEAVANRRVSIAGTAHCARLIRGRTAFDGGHTVASRGIASRSERSRRARL